MTDQVTVGSLIKVVSIDALDGTVYFRVHDGRTGRHSSWRGVLPERGNLFILSDDGWDPAPAEAWPEANSIAIVKRILEDGTVLLEASLGIRTAYNHRGVAIDINYTVEYNEVDGIVRVVSETPIRSRDFGMDAGDVEKEYHVASSGDGPSFDDFGGYPEVITRARELIETQLERREKLDEIGARPVKGVLFTGPPGTGKTRASSPTRATAPWASSARVPTGGWSSSSPTALPTSSGPRSATCHVATASSAENLLARGAVALAQAADLCYSSLQGVEA